MPNPVNNAWDTLNVFTREATMPLSRMGSLLRGLETAIKTERQALTPLVMAVHGNQAVTFPSLKAETNAITAVVGQQVWKDINAWISQHKDVYGLHPIGPNVGDPRAVNSSYPIEEGPERLKTALRNLNPDNCCIALRSQTMNMLNKQAWFSLKKMWDQESQRGGGALMRLQSLLERPGNKAVVSIMPEKFDPKIPGAASHILSNMVEAAEFYFNAISLVPSLVAKNPSAFEKPFTPEKLETFIKPLCDLVSQTVITHARLFGNLYIALGDNHEDSRFAPEVFELRAGSNTPEIVLKNSAVRRLINITKENRLEIYDPVMTGCPVQAAKTSPVVSSSHGPLPEQRNVTSDFIDLLKGITRDYLLPIWAEKFNQES